MSDNTSASTIGALLYLRNLTWLTTSEPTVGVLLLSQPPEVGSYFSAVLAIGRR